MSFFSAVKLRNILGSFINPATEDTLALIKAKTDNIDVALSTRTKPSDIQNVVITEGDENIGRVILRDINGNTPDISRFGQLIVGQRHEDILCRFEYNNSTEDISITTTGTGTSSNGNSVATVSTDLGVGSALLKSKRIASYRPGHEIYFFGTLMWGGTMDANTSAYGGIFDANDGFAFGYNGTTFGILKRSGGSDSWIAQSSWNKDKLDGTGASGFNLDKTKFNQFKITYGWLGSAPDTFSVYGGESIGWITCHVIDISNSQTVPSILSPSNPISLYVNRTSGSSAITLSTSSIAAGSIEGVHAHAGHRVFAGRAATTVAAGVDTHIATFLNNTTFQGKNNKVRIEAVFMGAASDGAKSIEILFYKNATVTGGSYSSVDANNSVTSINTTATVSGGKFSLGVPLAKVDTATIDLGAGHIHLELLPGETMSIVGRSAASNDVIVSFRWEEYFS